jgi:hypothetical protein
LAEKIKSEMPTSIPVEKLKEDANSLQVFRYQEVLQFNRLISVMKKSLTDLIKAIEGTVVMSI